MKRLVAILILPMLMFGCVTRGDLWQDLNRAARPASDGVHQTRLAAIGEIQTPEGRFYVAQQSLVLTGMLAPRGMSKLLLFDMRRRLVASYDILSAVPLWCEGPRIYLGGHGLVHKVPVDPRIMALYPDSAEGGNVMDFSRGIHEPFITREKRYGSSGGIEDDPWKAWEGEMSH
jgi:hypothetical protein